MVPRRFRGSLAALIGSPRKSLGKPSASDSRNTPPGAAPPQAAPPSSNPIPASAVQKDSAKTG
jgi:hypothetical protein